MREVAEAPTATGTEMRELGRVVSMLAERDRWERKRIEELRGRSLRELIAFSVARSPYYREVLGADAAERPLSDFPVLTKATMMENLDEIVTDPRITRDAVDAHLAGPDPGADFLGEYTLVTTSGTTGAFGAFTYSGDELRIWLAAVLRAVARLGGGPGMKLIGIGSPDPLFMSRRIFAGLQQTGSETPPDLSVTTPLEAIVQGLNEYQPEAMLGYPSVTALLAEEQLAGRLQIDPRIVACGSEVLTEDGARRIEEAWNVRPANGYVTTEVCPIANSCPQDVGLHVTDDLVIIEVVDERGEPVPAGTPGHRILVTNLVNRVQPLIRYELTDSVTIATGPNPTGMPWQRIAQVDGRSAEILRLPGREGEVRVHPHRLRAPLATIEDVVQYQFVFDGERLAVDFMAREGATRDLAERIRAELARALEDAGATGVRAEARRVEEIAREPGGAAKLKQVKLVGRARE